MAPTDIPVKTYKRTLEQRMALVVKAQILDADGYYVAKFFSEDTVKKQRELRKCTPQALPMS